MKTASVDRQNIADVRRFNRFYTRQIGILRKNYLDSPYSLGEMRVLYEIGQADITGECPVGRDDRQVGRSQAVARPQ